MIALRHQERRSLPTRLLPECRHDWSRKPAARSPLLRALHWEPPPDCRRRQARSDGEKCAPDKTARATQPARESQRKRTWSATPSSRARFCRSSSIGPSPAIVKIAPGILLLESGEGAKSRLEPFFLNQPARLQKFPSPVARPSPRLECDLPERNTSAMHTNLCRRTPKFLDRVCERLRADEHEPRDRQHFPGRAAVARFVQIDQNVRAMK